MPTERSVKNVTDDLPPMLSLIQTLCRRHLQHQWELYQELRGKIPKGEAIRTQFTKLHGKPEMHTQPYVEAAGDRYSGNPSTEFRITDVGQMSRCKPSKPTFIISFHDILTQFTMFLFPFACLRNVACLGGVRGNDHSVCMSSPALVTSVRIGLLSVFFSSGVEWKTRFLLDFLFPALWFPSSLTSRSPLGVLHCNTSCSS